MTQREKGIKTLAVALGCFLVIIIFSTILGVVTSLINVSSTKKDNLESIKEEYKHINELNIELETTNLEIYRGSEFKIEKFDTKDNIHVIEDRGKITIKERGKHFWNTSMGGTLVFYIPDDMELNILDIEMNTGKSVIEDLNINKFSLEVGAGSTSLTNITSLDTSITGGAGKIEIKNSNLTNLDMETGVGSTSIEGKLLGKNRIECGVGSVRLNLNGNIEDYTIKTEKGIGSIKINGEDAVTELGTGPNNLKIKGGIGSITVDFEN